MGIHGVTEYCLDISDTYRVADFINDKFFCRNDVAAWCRDNMGYVPPISWIRTSNTVYLVFRKETDMVLWQINFFDRWDPIL